MNEPEPSSEKRRFLAPLSKPRDYVDRPELAVPHEPECIGPAIVDGYASIAAFHQSLRHQQAVQQARMLRPLLETEDRILDAERRAKQAHRGKDLHNEFRVIRRILISAQAGGRRTPQSVIVVLERIEASLDGISVSGTV